MSNLVRGRWDSRRVQAAEKSLEKKRKNVSRCHIKMTLYQKIIVFCSIYTEIEKKGEETEHLFITCIILYAFNDE